jgi:cobalt-zinc-cadmium efflux system protein
VALGSAILAVLGLVTLAFASRSGLVAEDALHALLDLATVAAGLFARRLAQRPPDERGTFGWARVDALVGAVLALVLIVASVLAAVAQAQSRTSIPSVLLGLATLASLLPAWPMLAVAHTARGSASARALGLHGIADLGATLITGIAALASLTSFAHLAQVAAAAVIALLVSAGSLHILQDAANLALDLAPAHVPPSRVRAMLEAHSGVEAIHHIHVWRVDGHALALSAHVVTDPRRTVHETQLLADELRRELYEQFGITHATLEFECHRCDREDHDLSEGPQSSSHERDDEPAR